MPRLHLPLSYHLQPLYSTAGYSVCTADARLGCPQLITYNSGCLAARNLDSTSLFSTAAHVFLPCHECGRWEENTRVWVPRTPTPAVSTAISQQSRHRPLQPLQLRAIDVWARERHRQQQQIPNQNENSTGQSLPKDFPQYAATAIDCKTNPKSPATEM